METNLSQRRTQRPETAPILGRIGVFTLLDNEVRTTSSGTVVETLTVVLTPQITPNIEDLLAHVRCLDRTPDFRWKLSFRQSWDGETWSEDDNDLLDLTGDVYPSGDYLPRISGVRSAGEPGGRTHPTSSS